MSVSRFAIGQIVYFWSINQFDVDSAIVQDVVYHCAEFTNNYEGYLYKLDKSKFGSLFSAMPETHLFGSRLDCLDYEERDADERLKSAKETCNNITQYRNEVRALIDAELNKTAVGRAE